jgi:adenosylcobinamide-GDP ribazoletransferase
MSESADGGRRTTDDVGPGQSTVVPRPPPIARPGGARDDLRTGLAGPFFALQFLTIAPPLVRRPPRPADLGAADAFFPAVGLAIGCALAGLDAVLSGLAAPHVRDVLLVGALATITGALHLDGLADSFDGLFGGGDAASRLAVMRDPRVGAYGVVALVCLLLLKVAALGALAGQARVLALVLAPCLGRWAIVQATWSFPYARPEGLGRGFKDGLRGGHVAVAALTALAAAAWLIGPGGAALFAVTVAFVWAAGMAMVGRLGGLTGDTYGALCEVVETGVLVTLGLPVLAGAS